MTVTLLPSNRSNVARWLLVGLIILGFYGALLVLEHLEQTKVLSYNSARATMLVLATASLFLALAWTTVIRAWGRFITCLGIYVASALIVYNGRPAFQARAILIALAFALLIAVLVPVFNHKKHENPVKS